MAESMKDIRAGIGKNVVRLRREHGLSRQALARKARVAPSSVKAVEENAHDFTLLTLVKLAQALRVAPLALVAGRLPRK
jgi:transcriptional regulator with XRE-family HTH domain